MRGYSPEGSLIFSVVLRRDRKDQFDTSVDRWTVVKAMDSLISISALIIFFRALDLKILPERLHKPQTISPRSWGAISS